MKYSTIIIEFIITKLLNTIFTSGIGIVLFSVINIFTRIILLLFIGKIWSLVSIIYKKCIEI